ncbi:MAG: hypothetical protein ACYDD1_19320 [Caulobacteraceae bacterium]
MIDPDADPNQLDLEDALPLRQASFVFWRPTPPHCEVSPIAPMQEEHRDQLFLPLSDAGGV